MALGKYRFLARRGYPVTFGAVDTSVNAEINQGLSEHVLLPEVVTPDILTFSGKMVESGANLNRAFFDVGELVKAHDSIPYKAVDIEHELDKIVGHIWSHSYIDRASNKKLEIAALRETEPDKLIGLNLDVMIGGVIYVDRFPQLESPMKRKGYALSLECYFDSFDLLLENGVRVSLEEAQALGLSQLVEMLMSQYEDEASFERAHTLMVKAADSRTSEMKVFKYLQNIIFSGVAVVMTPACPSCVLFATDRDDCECEEKVAAGEEERAELLTLDLTKIESYMRQWRESKEGKPLNVQVKEELVDTPKEAAEDLPPIHPAMPFVKDRDPNAETKSPSTCPQYKYELWVIKEGAGDAREEEQLRHWCLYSNEKCPTAGDRTWHECNRWYKRGEDWIEDMRNFRDDNNPFNYELKEEDGEPDMIDASFASKADFKHMDAMIDSFLYKLEAVSLDKPRR